MTKEQIELAKRRAWVEEHFHYYGWTDEEVIAFPILPSSNFDEGFEAGIRSVQWNDTNELQPDDYENVLVCIVTEWSSEFAIAYYDGKNWYTSDGMKIKPLCWMKIPEYNINGFNNRKYNNTNTIEQ